MRCVFAQPLEGKFILPWRESISARSLTRGSFKCSGGEPCGNCQRRSISCVFKSAAQSRVAIRLDNAEHKTPASFSTRQVPLAHSRTPKPRGALVAFKSTTRHLYYFDVFIQRNAFGGGRHDYGVDIRKLMGTDDSQFLVSAVTALGALQSSTLSQDKKSKHGYDQCAALKAYSESIMSLRDAMAQDGHISRLQVMWTTLLLGLFELMQDDTGHGWLQHMTHGTAAALQASGPSACINGPGRSFFQHARLFEVSKALLRGESSFLSMPEWESLIGPRSIDGVSLGDDPLDAILYIITKCARLRLRAEAVLRSTGVAGETLVPDEASDVAEEGFHLRAMLKTWEQTFGKHWQSIQGLALSKEAKASPELLLSSVYFSAISIFLSGVFDYEILHWDAWQIAVPTLSEDAIQVHLGVVLSLTDVALSSTTLSPLLFLFPLRIVGSRSYQSWQRDRVLRLLERISQSFAVAKIFKVELGHVWDTRDAHLSQWQQTLLNPA